MSIPRGSRHNLRVRATQALILFTLGAGATLYAGQQKKPLSGVISASVPFYPRTPQLAHIEGIVRFRISTDGNRASSIKIQSGQPMLARAAQENVKTWQFEEHSPITFDATFRYKLLPSKCDSQCNCGSVEKPSVLMRLPTEVEVNAEELVTCGSCAQVWASKAEDLCVLHEESPGYTRLARIAGLQGDVQVHIVVSAAGAVTDAHAVSGHVYLRKLAEDNVKKWTFGAREPRTADIVYQFRLKEPAIYQEVPSRVTFDLPYRVTIESNLFPAQPEVRPTDRGQ
jgi:outer membrane biosynthesis protein TonB